MNKPKFFKAWILFFVVVTVGGFFVGALFGGVAGFILALLNPGNPDIVVQNQTYFTMGGYVLGVPVSYFAFRWAVSNYIVPQFKTAIPEQEEMETTASGE